MSSLEAILKYREQVKSHNQTKLSGDTSSVNPLTSIENSVLVEAGHGGGYKGGDLTLLSGNSELADAGGITLNTGSSPTRHGDFIVNAEPSPLKTLGGRGELSIAYVSDPLEGQSAELKAGGSLGTSGNLTLSAGSWGDIPDATVIDITTFLNANGLNSVVGGSVTLQAGNSKGSSLGVGGDVLIRGGTNGQNVGVTTTDYGRVVVSTGDSTNTTISGKIEIATGNGPYTGDLSLETGNGSTVTGNLNISVGNSSSDVGIGHLTLTGSSLINSSVTGGGDRSAGEVRLYGGRLYQNSSNINTDFQGGKVVIQGGEVEIPANPLNVFGWKGGSIILRGGTVNQPSSEAGDILLEGNSLLLTADADITLSGVTTSINTPTLNIDSDTINLTGTTPDILSTEALTVTGSSTISMTSSENFSVTSDTGGIDLTTTVATGGDITLTSNGAIGLFSDSISSEIRNDILIFSESGTTTFQNDDEDVKFRTRSIPVGTNDLLNNRLSLLMKDGILSAFGLRIVGTGMTQMRFTNVTENGLNCMASTTGGVGDAIRSSYEGEVYTINDIVPIEVKCLFSIELLNGGEVTKPFYRDKTAAGYVSLQGELSFPLATPQNPFYVNVFYVFFEFSDSALTVYPTFN